MSFDTTILKFEASLLEICKSPRGQQADVAGFYGRKQAPISWIEDSHFMDWVLSVETQQNLGRLGRSTKRRKILTKQLTHSQGLQVQGPTENRGSFNSFVQS